MIKLKADSKFYDKAGIQATQDFATCFIEICKAANAIPNEGGHLAEWVGENNPKKFGLQIVSLAKSMEKVSEVIHSPFADWDKDKFKKFADCVETIGEAKIPKNEDGWWQKLTSNLAPNVETFATGLSSLGLAMGEVDKSLRDATSFKDGSIITMFKNLNDVIDNLPSIEAAQKLDQWCTEIGGETFVQNLKTVGDGLAAFAGPLSSLSTTNISSSATSLDLLTSALKNASAVDFGNLSLYGGNLASIGNTAVTGFVDAFEGSYGSCADAMSKFATNVDDAFKYNAKYKLKMTGGKGATAMIDGLSDENKLNSLISAISNFWTNGLNSAEEFVKRAFNIGSNVGQGFIDGINSTQKGVTTSVDGITDFIGPRMQKNLDEESPSKLTYKIGAFVGDGLANGMLSTLSIVRNASDDLSNESITAINSALTNMYNAFDQDTFNPTITPVLDMSEVQNGFGYINGLLDSSVIGLASRNLNISSDMSNYDVIDTLNSLGETLGASTVNNYNVNGVTYDDGSNVASAVGQLIYAANIARRS